MLTSLQHLLMRTIRRFFADASMLRAAALAFMSLLAIVPISALSVALFTRLPLFDTLLDEMRSVLLAYLLPTGRQAVEGYLHSVVNHATQIPLASMLLLLMAVVALFNMVEASLNAIWRIDGSRSIVQKGAIFITMWTVLPLLIGSSIAITSYMAAQPLFTRVAAGAAWLAQMPFLLPWLFSSLALTMLYLALPQATVKLRPALVGGMVAGLLFELAKIGFTFYVTEVVDYEQLYGALSTLPVFLLWIYLIWLVILFGAELVYCLQGDKDGD